MFKTLKTEGQLRFCWLLPAMLLAMMVWLTPTAVSQIGANPFDVAVSFSTSSDESPALVVDITIPDGSYLYADRLQVSASKTTLSPVDLPAPKPVPDMYSDETVNVYDQDIQLRYRVAPDTAFPLEVTVAHQGCSESICFMPQTETYSVMPSAIVMQPSAAPVPDVKAVVSLDGFRITGRDGGYRTVPEFLAFLDRVEAGEGLQGNQVTAVLERHGVVIMVLFVLLGGLLLNLTPCVLPMIPVNLAIIGAGTQAGSRRRGFLLGGIYGLGIALVYGVLGVIVVLTGAQFGALNASPWFNMGIAALFLMLSLAMFGAFNIDLSRFQSGSGNKAKHGPFVTAFIFGGIAALLAGACVAPVLIGVLLLAAEIYQRGATAGLLLPFVLGLGMALPWPFAGAGMSFLPKPGAWMERIKIGFGVIILAAAVYYGQLGVRLLLADVAKPSAEGIRSQTEASELTWHTSLDEALALSREQGKPVFVDVWASWCKSCKAMSRTTFQDTEVQQRLSAYVPLKYQAEEPGDPETKQVLDALGVKGQPFYVVLLPE